MADLEARREARRRKILENSEKRLNKISGVEQKSTKSELDGVNASISYIDESESSLLSNSCRNKVLNHSESFNTENSLSSNSSLELRTIFQNLRSDENESVANYQTEYVEQRKFKKIHIFTLPVILSFILVILDLFQIDIKSTYLNKIFIPLLAYEFIEYFFGASTDLSPNFVTSLLLLTNIRNRFLTAYIVYLQYFIKIMQDLMVYFFVFTLSHGFLTFVLL